jgi:hypothetical protein
LAIEDKLRFFAVLAGVLLLGGCAGNERAPASSPAPVAIITPPAAPASELPHPVTDLSQISSANPVVIPTPQITPQSQPSPAAESNPSAETQHNIERLFVANIDQSRFHEGREPAPGDTSLLNDKARQYSDFSFAILGQTLSAARAIEPGRLKGRKLPAEIGTIELTATMDSEGRLTDIAIESHTGDHEVDEVIIDACKRGIWSRNPPAGALDADGNIRVRLRAQIKAYSFDRYGNYHYRTELGLALL